MLDVGDAIIRRRDHRAGRVHRVLGDGQYLIVAWPTVPTTITCERAEGLRLSVPEDVESRERLVARYLAYEAFVARQYGVAPDVIAAVRSGQRVEEAVG